MAAERAADRRRPAGDGDRGDGGPRIGARQAAQQAADYVEEMIGQPPEVVVAAEPSDSGWFITVEVLELARVPDTSDVLASYEVELDDEGEPVAYRRIRRYHRSWVGEE